MDPKISANFPLRPPTVPSGSGSRGVREMLLDAETRRRGDSGDRTASQRGSSVTLNGQVLGLKWYGCHRYATGTALIAGENRLEVQITTVLGNYMRSLTGNPARKPWTARQPLYPAGLCGPVRLLASV